MSATQCEWRRRVRWCGTMQCTILQRRHLECNSLRHARSQWRPMSAVVGDVVSTSRSRSQTAAPARHCSAAAAGGGLLSRDGSSSFRRRRLATRTTTELDTNSSPAGQRADRGQTVGRAGAIWALPGRAALPPRPSGVASSPISQFHTNPPQGKLITILIDIW